MAAGFDGLAFGDAIASGTTAAGITFHYDFDGVRADK